MTFDNAAAREVLAHVESEIQHTLNNDEDPTAADFAADIAQRMYQSYREVAHCDGNPGPLLNGGRDPKALAEVMQMAQDAQDAALGDSNDAEITLLRDALEVALRLLGQSLPEPRDPDDD